MSSPRNNSQQFIMAYIDENNENTNVYDADLVNPSTFDLKFLDDVIIDPLVLLDGYNRIIPMGIKVRLFDTKVYNNLSDENINESDRFNLSSLPYELVPNENIYDTPLELVAPIIYTNNFVDPIKLAVKNFSNDAYVLRRGTSIAKLVPSNFEKTTFKIGSIEDHIFRNEEIEEDTLANNMSALNLSQS